MKTSQLNEAQIVSILKVEDALIEKGVSRFIPGIRKYKCYDSFLLLFAFFGPALPGGVSTDCLN